MMSSIINKIIKCFICFKSGAAKPRQPFVSNTPFEQQAVKEKPLSNSGVDYLSPILIMLTRHSSPEPDINKKLWGITHTSYNLRSACITRYRYAIGCIPISTSYIYI